MEDGPGAPRTGRMLGVRVRWTKCGENMRTREAESRSAGNGMGKKTEGVKEQERKREDTAETARKRERD